MLPKDNFKGSIEKAEHFIFLYKLVHNTRSRSVKKPWADTFKKSVYCVYWGKRENITRIDGEIIVGNKKAGKSILIFQEADGIDRERFSHDYASELLRAALVFGVAATDRYFHDLIIHYSSKILNWKEEDVPKGFKKIKISVIEANRAVMKRVRDPKARPGHILKKAIQDELYLLTFQGPNDIDKAVKMLGIKDFWNKISTKKISLGTSEELKKYLGDYAHRRNQIVHEADRYKGPKQRNFNVRDIKFKYVQEYIEWLKEFIFIVDEVVTSEM